MEKKPIDVSKKTCRKCRRVGHLQRDCPEKTQDKPQIPQPNAGKAPVKAKPKRTRNQVQKINNVPSSNNNNGEGLSKYSNKQRFQPKKATFSKLEKQASNKKYEESRDKKQLQWRKKQEQESFQQEETQAKENYLKSTSVPFDKKPRIPRAHYAAYLSPQEVEEGLKTGKFLKGGIRINAKNRSHSYVSIEGLERDVFIEGFKNQNRALDNDIVVIEIQPKEEWRGKDNEDQNNVTVDEADKSLNLSGYLTGVEDSDDSIKIKIKKPVDYVNVGDSDDEEKGGLDEESSDETDDEIPLKSNNPMNLSDIIAPQLDSIKFSQQEENQETAEKKKKPKSQFDDMNQIIRTEELQPTGKVVHIAEAKHNTNFTGTISAQARDGTVRDKDRFARFIPNDKKAPLLLVPISQIPGFYANPQSYDSKIVLVQLRDWSINHAIPSGRFRKVIGERGEIEAETEALLSVNECPGDSFPDSVLSYLDEIELDISQEIPKRRDLTKERIFTIDPDSAKDLDDALHIKKLPDGNYELGVHIADVSHFVEPLSPLDKEAQHRCTTVYLVQKAIPMLPNLLCENLCSLHPGTPRLAFSCIFKLNSQGSILQEWHGKTVINSCSKMSYNAAQSCILEKVKESWDDDEDLVQIENIGPIGNHSIKDISDDVRLMWKIASNIRTERFKTGALSLNNSKLYFKLDEFNNPTEFHEYITKEANWLVEEFMLMANQSVARRISEHFPKKALLRKHIPPVKRKIEELKEFCLKNNFGTIDTSSAVNLSLSLEKLKVHPKNSPEIFQMIQFMCTKSLQLATYFCTGEEPDVASWNHFALNMSHYTHFTSPIRRYADIIVHRLLYLTTLKNPSSKFIDYYSPSTSRCSHIAEKCNDRKLAARKAQDGSSKLYLCIYLDNKQVKTTAIALGLGDKFINCFVTITASDKRVYMEDFKVDSFKYDKEQDKLSIYWPDASQEGGKYLQELVLGTPFEVYITKSSSTKTLDWIVLLPNPVNNEVSLPEKKLQNQQNEDEKEVSSKKDQE